MSIPTWLSQLLFLGATFYLLVWRVVLRHIGREWHQQIAAAVAAAKAKHTDVERVPLVTKAHVLQVVFAVLVAVAGGLIAHLIFRHSIGASTSLWAFLLGFGLFALGCLAGIAAADASRDERESSQVTAVMDHIKNGPAGHEMDVI